MMDDLKFDEGWPVMGSLSANPPAVNWVGPPPIPADAIPGVDLFNGEPIPASDTPEDA